MPRLVAFWGSGDAESEIEVTDTDWIAIRAGETRTFTSDAAYEGETFEVVWRFDKRLVTIDCEDGRQCVVGGPLEELLAMDD